MARDSSPTPLAPASAASANPAGERPSLNESLDELARLSDQLIDQLSGGPTPVVAATASSENEAPSLPGSAPGHQALGTGEPDLDAIFSDLEASTGTASLPSNSRIADVSVDRPVAEHPDQEVAAHNIREVLEHLESLPTAKSEAPWESIEPSVIPAAHGIPAPPALPSMAAADLPTRRGSGRYWLLAAGLAIAAGLGGALLLQGLRTERQAPPKSAVRVAPPSAPARRPVPPLPAPEPPALQEVSPSTTLGPATVAPTEVPPAAGLPGSSHAPAVIAAPAIRPTTPSTPPAKTKTAPAAVAPGRGKSTFGDRRQPPVPESRLSPPAAAAPVDTTPPAASATADATGAAPQVEYKILDQTPTEATLPAAPVFPAAAAPARPIYEPPRAIARTEPVYPQEARALGESGTIVVRLLINESGIVERGVIEAGMPGSKLEAAAIDAAMSWTYEPARQSGRPVRAWVTERVVFAP